MEQFSWQLQKPMTLRMFNYACLDRWNAHIDIHWQHLWSVCGFGDRIDSFPRSNLQDLQDPSHFPAHMAEANVSVLIVSLGMRWAMGDLLWGPPTNLTHGGYRYRMPNEPHRRVEAETGALSVRPQWIKMVSLIWTFPKCGIFQQLPWGVCWRILCHDIASDFTFSCPPIWGFCQGLSKRKEHRDNCNEVVVQNVSNMLPITHTDENSTSHRHPTVQHSAPGCSQRCSFDEKVPGKRSPTVTRWCLSLKAKPRVFNQNGPNPAFHALHNSNFIKMPLILETYQNMAKFGWCQGHGLCLALPWRRLAALGHLFTSDPRTEISP